MGETTTTSSEKSLAWYLRSLADHDTHRRRLSANGGVIALCGARFIPKPTVRVVGEPPGRLVDGPGAGVAPGARAGLPGVPARAERPVKAGRHRAGSERSRGRRSSSRPVIPASGRPGVEVVCSATNWRIG